MRITVYLGSNEGKNPVYAEAAKKLGTFIGTSGLGLVYGGSNVGLMGILAGAALESGAEVIGVEPRFFVESVPQLPGLSKLIVTPDMQTRKKKLIELGDAFIAFPGGTGTLEEISEVISSNSIGIMEKPYVFYSLGGYYKDLGCFFDHAAAEGFIAEEKRRNIRFASSLGEIREALGL